MLAFSCDAVPVLTPCIGPDEQWIDTDDVSPLTGSDTWMQNNK